MIALVSLNAHRYRRFRCCAYVERIHFGTALVDSTDPCGSIFLPIRAIMKGGDRVGHMDDVLMDGMGWDGLKLHSMNPGGKNIEEY